MKPKLFKLSDGELTDMWRDLDLKIKAFENMIEQIKAELKRRLEVEEWKIQQKDWRNQANQ
jgi:hypothetical protein